MYVKYIAQTVGCHCAKHSHLLHGVKPPDPSAADAYVPYYNVTALNVNCKIIQNIYLWPSIYRQDCEPAHIYCTKAEAFAYLCRVKQTYHAYL